MNYYQNPEVNTDFLIRLSPQRVDTNALAEVESIENVKEENYILPDGILHPRYSQRTSGTGYYVLCRRDLIRHLQGHGKLSAVLRLRTKVQIHSLIEDQVGWQLRERVIQVSEGCNRSR